ncbi:hypothetical protein M8J76_005721 [Diaphorina citri]|nr:hypothetical protein M8J76_005721 [Diaphorina citri]
MVERFLQLANVISPILLNNERAPPMVTNQELKVLKEICAILSPLEVATKDISGDKYCTAPSRTIPLMNIVNKMLDNLVVTTTQEGKIVLNALKTEFSSTRRFGHLEHIKMFAKATILDPRFKRLHFKNPLMVAQAMDNRQKTEMQMQSSPRNEEEDSSQADEDGVWGQKIVMGKKKKKNHNYDYNYIL